MVAGQWRHGRIERTEWKLPGENASDVIHAVKASPVAAFPGATPDVGGEHNVAHGNQRGMNLRLVFEDVQRSARKVAGLERSDQSRFIHDSAPRGVDKKGATFHLRQAGRIDEPLGIAVERQVQRNDIGLTQQPFERGIVGMIRRRALMKQDAQPKATRPMRDGLPDRPIANQTQRFGIE